MRWIRGYRKLTEEDMVKEIKEFINKKPEYQYRAVVGTDSKAIIKDPEVRFITALTVQRVGNGAIVFRCLNKDKNKDIISKLIHEAYLTCEIASNIINPLLNNNNIDIPLEVHFDVNVVDTVNIKEVVNTGIVKFSKTQKLAKSIIGMAMGYGFSDDQIKVKPDAFGASYVADHYTR